MTARSGRDLTSRSGPEIHDLLVLGGGVMGLFTAYETSASGTSSVAVLDRGEIGDPATASFGLTRSYRRDYLDPLYARLADEAMALWQRFERDTGRDVLVRCGCMNIAKRAVTPDLAATYAQRSTDVLTELGMPPRSLDRAALGDAYPDLDADLGHLDDAAGLVDLATVTATLLAVLAARRVTVHQRVETRAIERVGDLFLVRTDAGVLTARALVITAGHGTNDLLRMIPGCALQAPLERDRPSEARYYFPPAGDRYRFTSDALPVLAYLDTGVYVHPVVDGVIDAVKIGYYNPPDLDQPRTGVADIADFVAQCLPGLVDAHSTPVVGVDQCDYDLVSDDDFVLGPVPDCANVFVGVGWRGTGYKFAPWVGRVLAQLVTSGASTYGIDRFDPGRFVAAPADAKAAR